MKSKMNQKESSEAKSSKVAEERTKAKVATTVDLKKGIGKADRTVFVGNVPADVITSKIIAKTLKICLNIMGKLILSDIDPFRLMNICLEKLHLQKEFT